MKLTAFRTEPLAGKQQIKFSQPLMPDLRNTIELKYLAVKLKKYLGKSNAPSEIVLPYFVG